MAQAHNNWQYLGASGYVGAYTTTGGGGTPVLGRSDIDEMRMGVGRTPGAEYPDGYLGNIRSRRDDRGKPYGTSDAVLDSLRNRQNQRAYQRGVHKGERIDPSQYYWPKGMEPERRVYVAFTQVVPYNNEGGINYLVPRNAPLSMLEPAPHLVNDGKANTSANAPAEVDPRTVGRLSHLKPTWNY